MRILTSPKGLKIAASLTALLPSIALAQDFQQAPAPVQTPGQIVNVINTVAGWFFTVFVALAVIFLIYAAFLYLTAAGNEDRVGQARKTLTYAIIAIVVALLAGGVVAIITNVIDTGAGGGGGGGSTLLD